MHYYVVLSNVFSLFQMKSCGRLYPLVRSCSSAVPFKVCLCLIVYHYTINVTWHEKKNFDVQNTPLHITVQCNYVAGENIYELGKLTAICQCFTCRSDTSVDVHLCYIAAVKISQEASLYTMLVHAWLGLQKNFLYILTHH